MLRWMLGLLLLSQLWVANAHGDTAVVYSTDFFSGYYSRFEPLPPYTKVIDIESTCSDGAVRAAGEQVYILGRFGCDYVQVLDPTQGMITIQQFSTGNGTNPQDIEVCTPTKAYVSLYERDYLLIVNPQTGQILGQVDLSAFADADGLPEAAEMVRVGDRVYVALQRLDRPGGFVASNPSMLAVVDCNSDQVIDVEPGTPGVQAIVLSGRNPFGELVFDVVRQKLVVTETGNFGVLDGGIEFVDVNTFQPEGFFVSEQVLGGDLNTARLWVDCNGYAIITDPSFNTRLVRFDRCNGTLAGPCALGNGFAFADLEITASGKMLLADRDLQAPGVRVYRAPDCSLETSTPLGFGLPPQDIALWGACVIDEPTGVPAAVGLGLCLEPNRPDPFNPATTLRLQVPAGAFATLEVFDVRGRRVAVLLHKRVPAGGLEIVWPGTGDDGAALPSGVYWARLRTATTSALEKMTLVR